MILRKIAYILSNISTCIHLVLKYCRTYIISAANIGAFEDIETFCVFIGRGRTGHSLIGALLDAHPEVVLAHEENILYYVNRFSRNQMLLDNTRHHSNIGRIWGNYKYLVPDSWQGKYSKIRVIGDKKGGGTFKKLSNYPNIFRKLEVKIGVPVKIIHVNRNPFDNIATDTRGKVDKLPYSIDKYFSDIDEITRFLNKRDPDSYMTVYHEKFIDDPECCLNDICKFLGISPSREYLKNCVSIVRKKACQSRHKLQSSMERKKKVEEGISKFEILDGYSFET